MGRGGLTAANWDGLSPKDPINVVITGSFEDAGSALRFLRQDAGDHRNSPGSISESPQLTTPGWAA